MKLYDYLPSQNGYKVRLLLSLLDRAYSSELVQIFQGESHTPEFLAMNAAGAVPVLQLDDGRVIAESNAILCYLAEGTPYLPADSYERAKVLQWLFFEQDSVQPSIATLRHWRLTGKLERNAAQVPARRVRGVAVLEALERELSSSDFLAAGRYTVADISVFAYCALADEAGFDLAGSPALRAWIARIKAQPRHLAEIHYYSIDPHSGNDLLPPRAVGG